MPQDSNPYASPKAEPAPPNAATGPTLTVDARKKILAGLGAAFAAFAVGAAGSRRSTSSRAACSPPS